MDWLQVMVLALIQGLTEFLPVSSSAHLVLVPVLTDWKDQGLAFDVALHLGSLTAVLVYFRGEIERMLKSLWRAGRGHAIDTDARLALWVMVATVPVCVIGFITRDLVATSMRSPLIIGMSLAGFGVLLGIADWQHTRLTRTTLGQAPRSEYQLRLSDAVVIGLAQALALIPGTSRSGITMTAALFLGMSRESAARFSFLLSIPVIALAGGLEVLGLASSPEPIAWLAVLSGTLISASSAYLCIHYFLAAIRRIGMQPFVIYRVVFGLWLLWWFYA